MFVDVHLCVVFLLSSVPVPFVNKEIEKNQSLLLLLEGLNLLKYCQQQINK